MVTPVIGISTYRETSARWGVWDLPAVLLPAGYVDLVRAAGARAMLLPPDAAGAAPEVLARVDGVVIAGGPDVDPSCYGAKRAPETGPPAVERDAWELALIRAATAADLPLLGICRGMQLMNVARGGTLTQHLEGHRGTPGVFGTHVVKPVPGTVLGGVLDGAVSVPAFHHQAVAELGAGLVPSAHAEDGTVEAVELPDARFAVGVQWHPEMGDDVRVLSALVAAARR
ncbi:putative glutamine amidotransferase [Streptomyces sp. RB5]|uniref:Putative glutamine amidotransferase n=1 Tax=Streptomyces smaragdinus TaxID=2585196 RepID=A0A7K0CLX8_9ACTN|nr:gamma-glutamyl-gamma-aminobutyrate hydrolase family protein [Streptomyces smaragdinus]MQY14022.1 putative glutamine amidotransferase [Streptomyces smaragdinus]